MIFVRYELGSKEYQFWDAAHQHFEISCDVKFEETCFPAKEMTLAQPGPEPLSSYQIPELDNESDSSGLDLVKLAQPPTRPPSPGQSAPRQPVMPSQPPMPPPALPPAPKGTHQELPGMETAPLQPPTP